MAKWKSPCNPSKREKNRETLFTALLKMSQNLTEERRLLEDRVKSLIGLIHQMNMERKFDSLKLNFLLGLKGREASTFKHRYESADDELADFKEMLSLLSQKKSESKDLVVDGKGKGPRKKALQDEIRRLKSELEKIQQKKTSEVTALLDEKKFVWNQYNKMESDFTERLKNKSSEVDQANERMKALINKAEELESSNKTLRTDLVKAEYDSSQKTSEITRLLKEIEVLKSRSESETPVLRPCRTTRGSSATVNGSVKVIDKEVSNTEKMSRVKPSAHKSTGGKAPKKQLCVRGSSTLKRRADDVITIPDDTPKLFTSSFKVPKLKRSLSKLK